MVYVRWFLDLKSRWIYCYYLWITLTSSLFFVHLLPLVAYWIFCLKTICIDNFRPIIMKPSSMEDFCSPVQTDGWDIFQNWPIWSINSGNGRLIDIIGSQTLQCIQISWYHVQWWDCQQEYQFSPSRSRARSRILHFNKLPGDRYAKLWITCVKLDGNIEWELGRWQLMIEYIPGTTSKQYATPNQMCLDLFLTTY